MTIKILTVVGTRPQFIKAAPVSRLLRRNATEILVHTGQHYDPTLSSVFFKELALYQPNYHFTLKETDHGAQTGEMLTQIERVLLKEAPQLVLVYGDTNSTLAGALAAAKLHIPIAHVEAGLRSYNRKMPEEINRVLTDHLSTKLFCPTPIAIQNLEQEGLVTNVELTGDVMLDALLFNKKLANNSSVLTNLGLKPKDYLLMTIHRAENTDNINNLSEIVTAINQIQTTTLLPLHPRTEKKLADFSLRINNKYVLLIKPVSYINMLALAMSAKKIITDSGGLQKEAFWLHVPCITIRNETEWKETVMAGGNYLAGPSSKNIIDGIKSFTATFPKNTELKTSAAANIVTSLLNFLGN
ncbi:MAG: hypothetical protein RLZ12_915 [Bacillota bacterium]